jgi:hypothetical protein
MDARTKAVKNHRKRLRTRRMKRVEVTVREHDAALLRKFAAALRRNDKSAARLRASLLEEPSASQEPTVAEVMAALPDISSPEFDPVFEEIERFRHDPIMMRVRH